MPSASEIRDRAAQELGILRLGQSLQSQDAARIDQGYAEVYEELKSDGLATWAFSGSVPNQMSQYVVFLISENCLGAYGVSDKRYVRIMNGAEKARREILKHAAPDHVSQDEVSNY